MSTVANPVNSFVNQNFFESGDTNSRTNLHFAQNLERHSPNPEIGKTPILNKSEEIQYSYFFLTDNKHYLTCIDKYSKFAAVQFIPSVS